jgi:hypothetical protein
MNGPNPSTDWLWLWLWAIFLPQYPKSSVLDMTNQEANPYKAIKDQSITQPKLEAVTTYKMIENKI